MSNSPKKPASPYVNMPELVEQEVIAKLLGLESIASVKAEIEQFTIEGLEFDNQVAKARIDGFETQVRFRKGAPEGECTCPESDGFEFCRHCAALCLQVNRQVQQISALDKGPDKSKVMAYLQTLDKQDLSRQLLDLISDDPELFDRYLLKSALNRQELDYAQLKTRITELTKIRERLFSQRQVKHFFAKIERLFDEFMLVETYAEPDKMLKVIEYAVQRLNKVLAEIEDNSGLSDSCIARLQSNFIRLFNELGGRDETRLKRLMSLWLIDQYQVLPQDLTQILTESAVKQFHEMLAENVSRLSKVPDFSASDWLPAKLLRYLIDDAHVRDDVASLNRYKKFLEG